MDSGQQTMQVGGETIRKGTSLYHTQMEEVLWYAGTEDGYVRLEEVDGSTKMLPKDVFRTQVLTGDIHVQAHPPGAPK